MRPEGSAQEASRNVAEMGGIPSWLWERETDGRRSGATRNGAERHRVSCNGMLMCFSKSRLCYSTI